MFGVRDAGNLLLISRVLLIRYKESALGSSRPVPGHVDILGAQEATIKDGVHAVLGGGATALHADR